MTTLFCGATSFSASIMSHSFMFSGILLDAADFKCTLFHKNRLTYEILLVYSYYI